MNDADASSQNVTHAATEEAQLTHVQRRQLHEISVAAQQLPASNLTTFTQQIAKNMGLAHEAVVEYLEKNLPALPPLPKSQDEAAVHANAQEMIDLAMRITPLGLSTKLAGSEAAATAGKQLFGQMVEKVELWAESAVDDFVKLTPPPFKEKGSEAIREAVTTALSNSKMSAPGEMKVALAEGELSKAGFAGWYSRDWAQQGHQVIRLYADDLSGKTSKFIGELEYTIEAKHPDHAIVHGYKVADALADSKAATDLFRAAMQSHPELKGFSSEMSATEKKLAFYGDSYLQQTDFVQVMRELGMETRTVGSKIVAEPIPMEKTIAPEVER